MRLPDPGQEITLHYRDGTASHDAKVTESHGLAKLITVVRTDPIIGTEERALIAFQSDGSWWIINDFQPPEWNEEPE